jgi:hypothetical protein
MLAISDLKKTYPSGLAREALERVRAIDRFLALEYQPLLDRARKGSLDVPANFSGVERVVHGQRAAESPILSPGP